MNSTDFSVRRKMPTDDLMRSLGTTTWMPLDVRTFRPPVVPARDCVFSVHTPVALMTERALTVKSLPVSASLSSAPVTLPVRSFVRPVTWTRLAAIAPWRTAERTRVTTSRASSTRAS